MDGYNYILESLSFGYFYEFMLFKIIHRYNIKGNNVELLILKIIKSIIKL